MNEIKEESKLSGPLFHPALYLQRYHFVCDVIQADGSIERVVDFGCAEGQFIRFLKTVTAVRQVACVDVDDIALEECVNAARPLPWDYTFGRSNELTVNVYRGSVVQSDCRLENFDVVTCIELIEHLHPHILSDLPANVFGYIKPRLAIFTTPNSEFNVLFPQLSSNNNLGKKRFRHWDHKFEWSRKEFDDWCRSVVANYPDYSYELSGVGEPPKGSPDVGFCTQIAVFRLKNSLKRVKEDSSQPWNYKLINSFFYEKKERPPIEEDDYHVDWDVACGRKSAIVSST